MEYKVKTPNKPTNSRIFLEETGCFLYTTEKGFFVEGANSQDEAQALLDGHNPPAPTEPTVEEKLASVGLSIDDLKTALNL